MTTQVQSTSKGAALVTGAAQGIGKAIALRLAADGFDVAINDLSSNSENLELVAEEIRGKGVKALTIYADVSVEEEVEKMVAAVVETFGGLNVMVANAGIMMWKSIDDLSAEDWDRVMSINLRSVFLAFKYGGRAMVAGGTKGGRLIAAGSIASKVGKGMLATYTASKFAVRGLTQCAAQEYGRHGITVNAYAPGVIDTPMLTYMDSRFGETVPGSQKGDFIKYAEAQSLVGGNGEAADVAGLVSYLASPESKFITGQTINVNGGTFFD